MRRLPIVLTALILAAPALAQEERPLTDLFVCQLDAEQALVRLKFDASPCWEPQDPVMGEAGGTPTMTVGTTQVGEICTMNIVIYEYEQSVPLADGTRALKVSVNAPDGGLIGEGTAAVAEGGNECTPTPPQTAAQ